jgi:hypothetical protein
MMMGEYRSFRGLGIDIADGRECAVSDLQNQISMHGCDLTLLVTSPRPLLWNFVR